jgi:tetratricopeptide (TPR) repeat protein
MIGHSDDLEKAERLWDAAEAAEARGDLTTAVELYREIPARLSARQGFASLAVRHRAMAVCALNAAVVTLDLAERSAEAVGLARDVVRENLETAPSDATEAIVNASFRVAEADREEAPERSLALVDRVIDLYGQPGTPGVRRTLSVGEMYAGLALEYLDRPSEALARYEAAQQALDDHESRGSDLDGLPAEVEWHTARVLFALGRRRDALQRLTLLVERWSTSPRPDVVRYVRLAQDRLHREQAELASRMPGRRRGPHG